MPKPLAVILSALFFIATAAILALPVITSSAELVLRPEPFEGLVGESSHPTLTLDATLDEGTIAGVPWSLLVSERPDVICFSFRMGSDTENGSLVCTRALLAGTGVGPSQFIPAAERSPRSALIAGLPGNIEELQLRATDDLPIEGRLYALPSNFQNTGTVLVAFLPAGADIVEAHAVTDDGKKIDVSRLADQVDAL